MEFLIDHHWSHNPMPSEIQSHNHKQGNFVEFSRRDEMVNEDEMAL